MTLHNVIKRLLLGAIPVAGLVCVAGCESSGGVYAEPAPAAYYEGPTYYRSPDVVYVEPGYRRDGWDHNRHHYIYRSAPRVEHRSGVDVQAHFH